MTQHIMFFYILCYYIGFICYPDITRCCFYHSSSYKMRNNMAKLKFLILPTQGTLTMYCFLFSHFSISPFFKQRYSQRLSQPFNDCSSHFNDYPHFVFFIFSFVVLPQSPNALITRLCPVLPHYPMIYKAFHSPSMADEKYFNHSFVSS